VVGKELRMSVLVLASSWNPIVLSVVTLLFVAVSLLLILTVLIQKPQGGGLSGAFGAGAGSGQTAFGAKTGDALTVITILMFVAWLAVAVAMNYGTKPAAADRATEAKAAENQTGTTGTGTTGTTTPAPEAPAAETKAPETPAAETKAPESAPAAVPPAAPAPTPASDPAPAPGSNPK
jgi:protein translocase SecG subunit